MDNRRLQIMNNILYLSVTLSERNETLFSLIDTVLSMHATFCVQQRQDSMFKSHGCWRTCFITCTIISTFDLLNGMKYILNTFTQTTRYYHFIIINLHGHEQGHWTDYSIEHTECKQHAQDIIILDNDRFVPEMSKKGLTYTVSDYK